MACLGKVNRCPYGGVVLPRKMTTVLDKQRELEALEFIRQITGASPNEDQDFQSFLKDGVILCNLMNKLKPGTISKINNSKMAFMQMENIDSYINACKKVGVPEEYQFVTVDLYDGKNLGQVALNIIALKRQLGFGFQKMSKDSSMPTVNVRSDNGLSSSAQNTVSKLPQSPQEAGLKYDVKRVGPAKIPGHLEVTTSQNNLIECIVCAKLISGACINACNATWHPTCFNCKKCGVNLARAKFYEHDAKPYCERCILIVVPQQEVRAKTVDKGFAFTSKEEGK
jgi:hypothetical protein